MSAGQHAIDGAPAGVPVGGEARRFLLECRAPLLFVVVLKLAIYLVAAGRYGYMTDELYFLEASRHLDLGYVDFPPLIAWLVALVGATLGESLHALRLPALACGVAVTWVGIAIAWLLGSGRIALWLTTVVLATAPAMVSFQSILTMNAFDQLWWGLGLLLGALYLRFGDGRLLVAMGAVAGLGLLTKLSVVLLAAPLLAVLVLARPRCLREPHLYIGLMVAFALGSPFLYWQIVNDYPFLEFRAAYDEATHESGLMQSFLLGQIFSMNPPHAILWLPGFYQLLAGPRRWRPLGWLAVAVLVLCYAAGVRFYFYAPMYLLLVAAGALCWERWLARLRPAFAAGFFAYVAFNSAVVLPAGAPLLPARWLESGLAELAAFTGRESMPLSSLFPHFAEMHGWPELAHAVAGHHRARRRDGEALAIVANHYGQASAVNQFEGGADLPRACSGHMQYYAWCKELEIEAAIAVGYEPQSLSPLFSSIELLERFDCELCSRREDGLAIALVRGRLRDREATWLELRRLHLF